MDSDVLRWLLLIVVAIVLCIWYLRYQVTINRKGSGSTPVSEQELDSENESTQETTIDKKNTSTDDDKLIIISIGSKKSQEFSGSEIINLLSDKGLIAGKFSIYHRYIQADGNTYLVYSVINGIEPGYLDEAFSNSTTPSIMFFFDISQSYNPIKAFDQMLQTAQEMAMQLGATVYDKDFSVMTEQTISYLREIIREKERDILLSENE